MTRKPERLPRLKSWSVVTAGSAARKHSRLCFIRPSLLPQTGRSLALQRCTGYSKGGETCPRRHLPLRKHRLLLPGRRRLVSAIEQAPDPKDLGNSPSLSDTSLGKVR